MGMRALDDLRDKFCDELEEISRKPEMGAGDLELVHKLTDTIKNIDKITIMEEDGGYSQAGDWEARGRFGDMYSRDGEGGNGGGYGNSYGGRRRDSMGRYSRDGGNSYRGGRGRYSRGGDMMEHLDLMMDMATDDRQRDMIQRFKREIQQGA